jgi:hypothetical protein
MPSGVRIHPADRAAPANSNAGVTFSRNVRQRVSLRKIVDVATPAMAIEARAPDPNGQTVKWQPVGKRDPLCRWQNIQQQ